MSDVVIKAEGLGKKYMIGHQAENGPYLALRDVLMHNARGLWHKTRDLARGKPIITGDSLEEIWALKDVSFEIRRGEAVGIIGRNGAGKSTLLKVLSRITEPSVGRVTIQGRVASLLEVGTGFHPELTGRENIYLNGAILGMTRVEIKRKFDEIVDFAEVEKFLDTPVKRYSSGMYVRLAFAVAAHLEPEILVVDEVLAVGDAAFQKKCLGKMGNVAEQGRTVLFVSHNMVALKSLCARAIWLDSGHILRSGETDQVVLDYLQIGDVAALERVWKTPENAPGNANAQIHSACIRPVAEDTRASIAVDVPLQLDFQIWNWMPGAILNFTIHLYTRENLQVFAAASDARPRHRGLVRATVSIPAGFLNDDVYHVSLQIVKDTSSTVYRHPELLVFEVQDSPRTGAWFGKWPGVVRPQLEWITQDLDGSESHAESW